MTAMSAVGIDAMHGEPIMVNKLEWFIIVACFAVVLAVADMNLDRALGL